MNKKLIAAIAVLALIFSGSAKAASGFVGIGGSFMSFDDGFEPIEPINISLRAGIAINEYIELGGEYSLTMIPDTFTLGTFEIDYDVDTTFLFVKANLPIGGGSKLYVMGGATKVTVTVSAGGASGDIDDSGTGLGFGLQVPTDNDGYFAFEYVTYYDDDEFDGIAGDFLLTGLNLVYVGYFR